MTKLPAAVPAVAAKKRVAVTAVAMRSAALRKHAAKMASPAVDLAAALKRNPAVEAVAALKRSLAVVHAEALRKSPAADPAVSVAAVCDSISETSCRAHALQLFLSACKICNNNKCYNYAYRN